jgi:hypothetical protein
MQDKEAGFLSSIVGFDAIYELFDERTAVAGRFASELPESQRLFISDNVSAVHEYEPRNKILYAAQYMRANSGGFPIVPVNACAPSLAFAFATRTITAVDSESFRNGGSDYVKGEGSFEEKTGREGRTGTRSRWIDFLTGRGCLRGGCPDTGYATESADCGS